MLHRHRRCLVCGVERCSDLMLMLLLPFYIYLHHQRPSGLQPADAAVRHPASHRATALSASQA